MLVGSLGSTYGRVIGSDEGINLGYTDGKLLVSILVNLYVIKLGIGVVTEMGSLDGSSDGSNYDKLEGLFLGSSFRSIVPGSD